MLSDGTHQEAGAQVPETHVLRDQASSWRMTEAGLTSSSPADASTEVPGQKAATLTAEPLGWTRLVRLEHKRNMTVQIEIQFSKGVQYWLTDSV